MKINAAQSKKKRQQEEAGNTASAAAAAAGMPRSKQKQASKYQTVSRFNEYQYLSAFSLFWLVINKA